jgi:biopolymer transport protein ExbD/biopolymer transport protein TolR
MGLDVGGGKGGVKYEPNVVPMIDVMLVLLIIFMVVTPLIASGFVATMPQGKHIEKRDEQDSDVTLGIDQGGNFFLNAKPVSKEKLEQTLRDIYAARATDKIMYFKADQKTPYSKVEEAIQLARKSGVRVMAAVTELPKEKRGLFGRR